MAVLAEMYSVVVRVATLNRRDPGGAEGYQRDCPNRSFCSDGEVCRVSSYRDRSTGEVLHVGRARVRRRLPFAWLWGRWRR